MAKETTKKSTAKAPTAKQLKEMEAANELHRNAQHANKALAVLGRCASLQGKQCDELIKVIEALRAKETPA